MPVNCTLLCPYFVAIELETVRSASSGEASCLAASYSLTMSIVRSAAWTPWPTASATNMRTRSVPTAWTWKTSPPTRSNGW